MTMTPLAGGLGALNGNAFGPLARGAAGLPVTIPQFGGGFDPLLGGSLGIGPTGLPSSLAGQIGNIGRLPFAAPQAGNPMGALAAQIPAGAGQSASNAALSLIPEEAAIAGRAGGLASRLPGLPNLALAEGVGGRALLGRASLGAGLGWLGSSAVDALNPGGQNSNIEQGLQGAAYGAGIGGTVGSVIPGLGTAVGAVVGGGIGGAVGILGNMFGGDKKVETQEDAEDVLAAALGSAGLDDATAAQILDTYDVNLQFAQAAEDDDQREQLVAQALANAQQQILGAMQQRQQMNAMGAGLGGPSLLAMQQQASQIFEPLAQDIETNAALYADAMQGIRPNLPGPYQAVADAQIARELTTGSQLADAYRAQAAMTPVAQRLTQYQQDYQNLAQQMLSQTLAQQATGATGGGLAGGSGAPTDIAALLTQMAG